MNRGDCTQLSLLALLSCLMTGCVTSALWDSDRFVRFHEPAAPPNLRLFESTENHDILVQYDEWQEMSEKLRKRTYWLGQDRTPFANPHKPAFVSAGSAEGLPPIPIHNSSTFTVQTNTGLAAVVTWSPTGFILYSDDRVLGNYVLPVYEDGSAMVKKVALSPLAVTADTGLVAGYLLLLYWSGQSGNCSH